MHLFVVGAGYVGLVTAVGMQRLGHRVTVHDIDAGRIESLTSGVSPIFEPGIDEALSEGLSSGRLTFTLDPVPAQDVDVAVVCVPTPRGPDGLLDLGLVEGVVGRLLTQLSPGQTIVVRSTLPLHGPDQLADLANRHPVRPALLINPEFMREGRAIQDFQTPSRVVVGAVTPEDGPAASTYATVFESLGAPIVVADARSVVLIKLASNVFLSAKVAFADELARLSDAMGADVMVVVEGLGLDPRIGPAFLQPGPGFGGSCFPDQAASIGLEAERRGIQAPLLASITPSNARHQAELVTEVGRWLGRDLAGSRIGILGLAFKANTDDVRESPALAIIRGLRAAGAEVSGYDPVAGPNAQRADPELVLRASPAEVASGADAVVVVTEWAAFGELDWADLAPRMRGDLVYDARRICSPDAVAAAGLRYVPLGRARSSGSVPPSRAGAGPG